MWGGGAKPSSLEVCVYILILPTQNPCFRRGSPARVILAKRSASVFSLKTQNINKNHFILCSSFNKMIRKTLIINQQARGTTSGNRGFWALRIKSLKTLDNLEGPFGNVGFWVGNTGYITAKIT